MANLQANFRSQCAIASDDPARFLHSVNQMFYENSADGDYATFFYAEYDEETRKLRYANCGHLPALLLRRNGKLEKLGATATVLGLFEDWQCEIGEQQLHSGDTLLMYTDGVTEAFNTAREEFGANFIYDAAQKKDTRLAESLRRNVGRSPQECVEAIVEDVRRHSPGEQQDDITLIVAKCS